METGTPKALSVKKNYFWNTLGAAVYLGCQWLVTIVVVVLSSDYQNSGILAFAMATSTIFASVGLYKMRTFQVSDIEGEYTASNYVAFRILSIVLGLLISVVYLLSMSIEPELFVSVLFYLLFKGDEVFCDVLYGIDQKASRMDFIGFSQIIRGVASLGVFSLGLYIFGSFNTATFLMFASCALVTLLFDLPHSVRFGSILPRIPGTKVMKLARTCLPGVLATLFTTMVVSVPRQVFGLEYGENALGVYAAVATPAVLVQVACSYLYMPIIGTISEKWAAGALRDVVGILARIVALMVATTVALIGILAMIGSALYSLVFGDYILDYLYLLTPVLISTGMVALMSFATDMLVIFRHIWAAMVSCMLGFLVCVASMDFWIDAFYMNGVTFATIAGYTIGIIIQVLAIVRVLASSDKQQHNLR